MSKIFNTKADYDAALSAATTDAEKMDVRLKYAGQIKDEIEEANKKGESETVTRLRLEAAELRAEAVNAKAEINEKSIQSMRAQMSVSENTKKVDIFDEAIDFAKSSINGKSDASRTHSMLNNGLFHTKAATDMTTGVVTVPAGGNPMSLTQFDGDIIKQLELKNKIIDSFGRISCSTSSFQILQEDDIQGSAAAVAEGGAAPKVSSAPKEKSRDCQKLGASLTYTHEFLTDVKYAASYLRELVQRRLNSEFDRQIIKGDGTGENWTGVYTDATASSMTTFAGAIQNETNLDVLMIAADNVANAGGDADKCFVSISQLTNLLMLKSTLGDTLRNVNFVNGIPMIGNMVIIPTQRLAFDEYLVCDSRLAKIVMRDDIFVANTYKTDQKYQLEIFLRGNILLPSNYKKAFVKGSFATDRGLIHKA